VVRDGREWPCSPLRPCLVTMPQVVPRLEMATICAGEKFETPIACQGGGGGAHFAAHPAQPRRAATKTVQG
jgi:hypothetical protein